MKRPLLGALVLVGICGWLGLGEVRAAVAEASVPGFGAFLLLSVGVFVVYAWRWQIVLRSLGAPPLPLATLLLSRASGHAASALLPSAQLGGEPVRALLLRRRGLDWPTAGLAVGIDRLLEMTAGAVAGPFYLAVFLHATKTSPAAVGWILAGMLVGLAALVFLYANASRRGRSLPRLARRFLPASLSESAGNAQERFAAFLRSRYFALTLGLSFLIEVLLVAELWTLTRAFGMEISLPTIGAALLGIGVAHLAPIPGALGSLEAAQVGVVSLAGGSAGLGLALGLLVRLRESLWTAAGGAYLYVQGIRWWTLEPAEATSGNASTTDPKECRESNR